MHSTFSRDSRAVYRWVGHSSVVTAASDRSRWQTAPWNPEFASARACDLPVASFPPFIRVIISSQSDPASTKLRLRTLKQAQNTQPMLQSVDGDTPKDGVHWWAHQDLNLEPKDYESSALTN